MSSPTGDSDLEAQMFFRQLLNDETACASYVLGCASHAQLAVAANRSGRSLLASP